MSISTSRIARATVLVAAGALALGLLPGTASAVGPTPNFSYIDCAAPTATCDQILWANNATGAGTAVALTPTADHYQTYSYDVSASGDTWVVGLRHGPVVDDSYDSTTGLVITHRGTNTGGLVTSRVLATSWDAIPVISADGTKVWWLGDGSLYKFTATFDETTGAISGSTAKIAAPLFVGTALETAWNLAISPDGTSAAVLFHNDTYSSATPPVITAHKDRVVAAKINTTVSPSSAYFERKYDTTTTDKTAPSANTFTFETDSTLLYDEYTFGDPAAPHGVTATIPAAGPHTTTTATINTLTDYYDVRQLGGDFWGWQDTGSGSGLVSTLGSTTTPTTVAPVAIGPRSDGVHTYRYVPSTNLPAPMAVAANRAVAHANLVLSARTVAYGGRPAFWGYNLYLQPSVGTTYAESLADEVDRGQLHWISVGETKAHTIATSGSTAFQKGLATYLGFLPPLTRNTYVWWSYAGDYLTRPGVTAKVLVTVVPKISVHVTRSSRGTTVSGGTTRRGGSVVLYRVTGTKQTKVATARINAVGSYTFGRRALATGIYRVVSVADATWAAARSANVKI